MERIIKFRAWDTEKGEMTYGYDIASLLEGSDFFSLRFGRSKVDWMQFTGIKDRKGKEIYEGDIYEVRNRGKVVVSVIAYSSHGFEGFDEGIGFLKTETAYGEVIGNIYENPDLVPKE